MTFVVSFIWNGVSKYATFYSRATAMAYYYELSDKGMNPTFHEGKSNGRVH